MEDGVHMGCEWEMGMENGVDMGFGRGLKSIRGVDGVHMGHRWGTYGVRTVHEVHMGSEWGPYGVRMGSEWGPTHRCAPRTAGGVGAVRESARAARSHAHAVRVAPGAAELREARGLR